VNATVGFSAILLTLKTVRFRRAGDSVGAAPGRSA
jgi:hypothetical protein